MLFLAFCLALAAAQADGAPPADAEIFARIDAGEVGRAEDLARAAIDAESAEPGRPTGAIADHLQALAERFYGAGTKEGVAAARRLYDRALALREAQADQDPAALANLLEDLSGLHFNNGDYGKSEEAERRALAIRSRIYPPGDPLTAKSRRDLGLIFQYQGRLQEAAPYLLDALQEIEAAAPQDWAQVAIGRNYLADLYRMQGRYADAAALLEDLVRQAAEKLAPGDPQFPYFLDDLAGVYRDQARFGEAESLLRRSLALRKAAAPRDDGAVARATLNLAELFRAQGKLALAEPLYSEALELARAALGAGSPELFEFINPIAVLDRDQGRLAAAEPRFKEALDLVERGLGPDHPRVAQSRLDLAELLRARARCEEAEPHYQRALEIREKALGPGHPDVAEALTARARCLASGTAGRDAARASLDRAIGILGGSEAHPAVAVDALSLRADLSHHEDPEGSRRDLAEALRRVEAMRPHRGGGEGIRAEFFGRYAPLYERLARWEVEAGHPDRALAAAERGRARALLDQLAAAHVGDAARLPPELERRQTAARADLAEVRERLTFEQSRADLDPQERLARVGTLEGRLEESTRSFRELYDEAKNANAAWRGAAAGEPASVAAIQQDVVPREGLLLLYEIGGEGSFLFTVPPPPGAVEAHALVVGPGDAAELGIAPGPLTEAEVRGILSGSAASGDRRASSGLLAHLAAPQGALARGIGGLSAGTDLDASRLHALWRVLVPPALWPRVARAREVLVIPDGPLFLLPFEALVVEPGADARTTRYWLDAGPVLRYAPSATLVHDLRRRAAAPAGERARPAALSVSDPEYGPEGPSSAPTVSAAPPAAAAASVRGAYLGVGGKLSRLPGTAAETSAVRAALGAVADVVVLQGRAARESAVRKELAGKRYIHIATHGLVDQDQESGELFAALALTPPPSGAPAGDDDGFLQLFEIYDLRLNAELAVLSACSSNAGRVIAGEGVFALSRGFLVAGARRVVASQWPVDDASTAELVGELFRRIAGSEKSGGPIDVARALRDAKLRVRRGKAAWAHPFFWASFVLTGVE